MNKIQQFHALHTSKEPLFLGNAWDLLSAVALEKAGFKAIGTTSWGIANTLGFADGELIDFDQHIASFALLQSMFKFLCRQILKQDMGRMRQRLSSMY